MNALHHNIDPVSLGLSPDGSLINSLRMKIVAFATNNGVLKTVS